MSSFFEELKRRNVFRVGVAYVVIAWLTIQVIETVSEPLGLPDWTVAFFIVLFLAGLPVVVIFSWAFELTPDGLKKTKDVDTEESVTGDTGKKLNYAIIAILVLTLGYTVWDRQSPVDGSADTSGEVTATMSGASVAVLPFVNMSNDPEQEFFSDGISEELLNLLAKIPDLRVPARTSSFQFKGQNLNIGDVAQQLNVDHVLEGSVRKSGLKVRVTAQLIEAETGYHLWSDTYDRELNDIFAIQDEISAAIVAALSETLGIEGSAAPSVRSGTDPDAYNAYLLAQHQIGQRTRLSIESAITNYEKALAIDPDYAPAQAGIGLAWYLLTQGGSTYGSLPLEESLAKAMPHLNRALELDPDLPEALGAYGLTLSAELKDDEAVPYFEKALERNPSSSEIRNWYASSLNDLGRPDEAFEQMKLAYELDPLSVLTLVNYSNHLTMRRRFEEAEPVIERLGQMDPARGAQFRGNMEIARGQAAAGTIVLLRVVDDEDASFGMRMGVAFNLWNLGLKDAARSMWPYPDNTYGLESNVDDPELSLEITLRNYTDNPNQPGIKGNLAWAYFLAGQKEEAFQHAEEFLSTLGDDVRPKNFINMIYAIDAWKRGDEERMVEVLTPLNEVLDAQLASGIEVSDLRIGKAILSEMLGDQDAALDNLEKAAFRGILRPDNMDNFFEMAGWGGRPAFDDLRQRHREYIDGQRTELLATACGPDGFQVWQPSDDECGRRTSPSAPN